MHKKWSRIICSLATSNFRLNFYKKCRCEYLSRWHDYVIMTSRWKESLREKCPNTEFFLVSIFSDSNWIQRNTNYLSVFSPNVGKYGPKKTSYFDIFHAMNTLSIAFKKVYLAVYLLFLRLFKSKLFLSQFFDITN